MSLERRKLDISNLVGRLNVKSTAITHVKVLKEGAFIQGHVTHLKFSEISADISETAQDIVTIWKTDKKSNFSYRMAPISMTFSVDTM